MKLRFENNSVRFRIRKSELLYLQQHSFIIDEIVFPVAVFTYELRLADVPDLTPILSNNNVTIQIPLIKANHWFNTDEVGMYRLINIDNDQALDVIIEKDFPCKDRPHEDKSDTFTELSDKSAEGNNC